MADNSTTHDGRATEAGGVLRHVADLIAQTRHLDYNPSESDGSWVCGDHGIPHCVQGGCGDLPWPSEPNDDILLRAFMGWADGEFRRVVRPYDEGLVSEMPEGSFRSYAVAEWPIGALLEVVYPPGQPS